MLEALGLDETCKNVYRAVLAHPQADLSELCERLGLSEDRLGEVLDRLSELALVRSAADEPRRFRAVDPRLGVQAIIARHEEWLAIEQHRIERIRLAAAQLSADFTSSSLSGQGESVERLSCIDDIRERIALLVRDVSTEVMTLAPGGAQSRPSMEAARPQDQSLLERGVRMRTLYLDSVRNSPGTVSYAKWLTSLGGEVRTAPSVPVRLMIMDRRAALVPIDENDSAAGAVLLKDGGTVTALCALFEAVWENAVPLLKTGTRERDERGLTPQGAEVLRLLGQGLTDEAVAKRLGVSPRTARRMAADLLELLGARSRFQAGARAVARGWLTGEG
ncbi:helix-turn-helix domain-containing protein [Nocardiopsis tropica]|uniref:Helix-turn-helix domain-containing protein n=1 Tax=Nocardiopsis tropica TaxID=109330 RepID=A0ABU7KPA5_9ACTN|nr:helix-turn-helix domain-containing protein [Nocardiopsis umidischolae]MEE2051136.1 helix-turn-helix domain-containing protein [Nocardiopsis umidischolae]